MLEMGFFLKNLALFNARLMYSPPKIGSTVLGSKGSEGCGHEHFDLGTISGPSGCDWTTLPILKVMSTRITCIVAIKN